jgi:hypothetical protein
MILLAAGCAQDVNILIIVLLVLLALLIRKRIFFKVLARMNKIICPSLYDKDIAKLTRSQKIILAYRYWVTRNSL